MGARLPVAILLTLALSGWSAAGQAPSAQADLPRVRLIATGGTISMREGGRLTADELVKLMPNVGRYARPEFEQFANVASSQLTLEQWLDLAKRINRVFEIGRAHV